MFKVATENEVIAVVADEKTAKLFRDTWNYCNKDKHGGYLVRMAYILNVTDEDLVLINNAELFVPYESDVTADQMVMG